MYVHFTILSWILNQQKEEYAGDYHKMTKIMFMVSATHSINSERLP